MNILIINEFLHLTSRIAKALTEPSGSLLLIGRSGVGRRSSIKVVSALQSVKLIMPITTNQPQFNTDLKNVSTSTQALLLIEVRMQKMYFLRLKI